MAQQNPASPQYHQWLKRGALVANLADPTVPVQFAGIIGDIEGLDNLHAAHSPFHIVRGSQADSASAPDITLNGRTELRA